MRKLISLIFILLAGFFPYMPLVHSGYLGGSESPCGNMNTLHHHGHESTESEDTKAPHDMSLCTSIAGTILRDTHEGEGEIVLDSSVNAYFELPPANRKKYEGKRLSYIPPDDPPPGSPQHLIGTVILTI